MEYDTNSSVFSTRATIQTDDRGGMADTDRLINRGDGGQRPYDEYVRPVMAEFVGVMLFVFVGVLSTGWDVTAAGLGHGLTIALLIMGLGEISGGHFNPAVTLGVALSGAIKPGLAVFYFLAQIVGGILGAAIVRGVLPTNSYKNIGGGVHHLGPPPGSPLCGGMQCDQVKPGWGILIEMMLTTVLVFTVLMTAVNPKTKTNLAPLAIGLAVCVDILAGGQLTGASMNPARAFGPAVCASGDHLSDAWKYHYIYWVGPALGALLAALLYRFFFASPSSRWVARRGSV